MKRSRKTIPSTGNPSPSTRQTADPIADFLKRKMKSTTEVKGRTKRTAARLAIVAAISEKQLKPGDFLPAEKKLTDILGVSLGTVQAALRQLQVMGVVIRRRGFGSIIASVEPMARSVWHFRFVSKADGTPLRITDEDVWIDTTTETGDWSQYLGYARRYLRIRRRLTLQNGTHAGAEMFIDGSTTPGLENIEPSELGMVGIRPYLEEKFGIITTGATHFVKTVSLDAKSAKTFGLRAGNTMFEIHAKAYKQDRSPVYFQRIYVSVDKCGLNV